MDMCDCYELQLWYVCSNFKIKCDYVVEKCV